ncbi:hypothetical protein FX987_01948 [Vreelandella titanicae]|uniref:Uncharacterized protein n=1 Tax=Vreelandella titanicae TaxID=664683 RepID=A0AAP9NMD5_9GAMM|nr:hypothetical protein FX987_01948 [Halomonas titanicae]
MLTFFAGLVCGVVVDVVVAIAWFYRISKDKSNLR